MKTAGDLCCLLALLGPNKPNAHTPMDPTTIDVEAARALTLPVLDLYIHPLYVLVSKILSSILNSTTPIHHLYHPLSTMGPTCHFI
jgi:hypothetical protein